MRRSIARLVAAGMIALALAGGCSLGSMKKRYRDLTGKSEHKEQGVELNTATRKRLASLPGLTDEDADRIIAHRPYGFRRDLVRKGVLSEAKFQKIRDDVYVDHRKQD
jgi:hypothetical protein